MICGVTVVMAVMKEMARKTLKLEVTQSPILGEVSTSSRLCSEVSYHMEAVKKTSVKVNGRRGKRSPKGQTKSSPVA